MRILAHPALHKNIREIEANGDFGRLFVRMENGLSPNNPKTSYMVALSVIGLLRSIAAPLVVRT